MPVPRIVAYVLGCLLLVSSGCGRLATVEGKLTLDDQPLANATIVFIPMGDGEQAGGVTGPDGSFHLEGTKAEGVPPGEYRVTVSKKEHPPGVTPPGPKEMSFKLSAKMIEVIPKRYTQLSTTPLLVTVPRGGIRDVHLALTKDGT